MDGSRHGRWRRHLDLIGATRGQCPHRLSPCARRRLPICSVVRGQCRARAKKEAPVDDLGPATAKWDYFDATGS